ncbi:MAG: hypothetical protein ACMZ7B_05745 [Balneola sp.]
MKKLYKYLLIGLLSITFTPITSFAQSIDANRMNRDINIMENILSELFRTTITSSNSNQAFVVESGGFYRGNSSRGTYMPGFGVIFMVSNSNRGIYTLANETGNSEYTFYYNGDGDEENEKVDQESITNRIKEFLRDYGSTIGQLKNDEKVMVIYGSKSNSSRLLYRFPTGQGRVSSDKQETLPVISVSSKVSDLNDFRSGKLTADNFNKRLAVATSEDKEYLDLKVMGNIFETALKDQDKESFRLSGSVDYMLLDNFGALFSLDVRYDEFGRATAVVWDLENRIRRSSDRVAVGQVRSSGSDTPLTKDELEERKKELEKNISTAYSNLVTNIKEYIVDYGRTLNSLSSDQYLLLSISVNGRYENVPDRLDIQIKKSVLEQLDKGSISREQALQRVVVTEY